MKKKRFWLAVVAVFFVTMLTDWFFHGVWLQPLYQATAQFWRPLEEMKPLMPFMWFGQFVFAWAFVWIYTQGINKTNQWAQAFRYAIAFLLVAKIPSFFGMWATSPYPADLIIKWAFIAFVQAFVCSFVMTWVYKPHAHTHHTLAA